MTLALTLVTAFWAVSIAIHASHRAAMTDKDRKDALVLLLGSFLIALVEAAAQFLYGTSWRG